jgi:hypothetical protein
MFTAANHNWMDTEQGHPHLTSAVAQYEPCGWRKTTGAVTSVDDRGGSHGDKVAIRAQVGADDMDLRS